MSTLSIRASHTVHDLSTHFLEQTGCGLIIYNRAGDPAEPDTQLRYLNSGRLVATVRVELDPSLTIREAEEAMYSETGLTVHLTPAGDPSRPDPRTSLADLAGLISSRTTAPQEEEEEPSISRTAHESLSDAAIKQLETEKRELKKELKEAEREVRALKKENTSLKDQLLASQKAHGKVRPPIPKAHQSNPRTNRITIKKLGKTYKFYLNNDYVGRYQYQGAFGTTMGFFISGKQKVAYHDLTVNYILADGKEETIFFDDFINNEHNWQLGNWEHNSRTLEDGALLFECMEPSKAFKCEMDLPYFDMNRDWRIECTTQFLDGNEEEYHYLSFGGDRKNTYQFGISMIGKFRFLKYDEGKWKKLIKAADSEFIHV